MRLVTLLSVVVYRLVMDRHDSTLVCASVTTWSLLVYDACIGYGKTVVTILLT